MNTLKPHTVIHLAGRAHHLKNSDKKNAFAFDTANLQQTDLFAKECAAAGVKKFIFISSIGVNGQTSRNRKFCSNSPTRPKTAYAKSKLSAELSLKQIASDSEMELIIIRPPLVYSAEAPGNFKKLLKLVHSGLPLPLASIQNKRSLVALENLVDFIIHCATNRRLSCNTFLISDDDDISTPDIIRLIAEGMSKSCPLFACPKMVLKAGALMTNQRSTFEQLCESLAVDCKETRTLTGWQPITNTRASLTKAGRDYQKRFL